MGVRVGEAHRRGDSTGTTFFIPIITPSYFRSDACRKELFKFTREATRLGLEQLLMPVYWVTVPELENDPASSADEAILLIARYEWQDLREVRLEDEDSSACRKAVDALAGQIARRAATVTATVEDVPKSASSLRAAGESGGDDDDDDEPGILEKIAASEEAMPELTEILETITVVIQEVGDLVQTAGDAMKAAEARGGGMKARLVVTERLAHQLNMPAERLEGLGHDYAATLAKLDPGVHSLLDAAEVAGSDDSDNAAEFLEVLIRVGGIADNALGELDVLVAATKEAATFSRSLRRPLSRMRIGLRGVLDGRDIIEEWGRRASDIQAAHAAEEGSVGETRQEAGDGTAGDGRTKQEDVGERDPNERRLPDDE